MLSVSIKISNIDYEKTFQQIFPMVKEKIDSMESKNMIFRLFQKLDDAAQPVLLGVMYHLPEETKDRLLVHCLNAYAPKLCEKLNEELKSDAWGSHFSVGSLWITHQDNEFFLQISQIDADYKALLEMDAVNEKINGMLGKAAGFAKIGVRLAVTLAQDALEKKGLEVLWKEENKQKLMTIAKNTLDKYGFAMELNDIQIMQEIAENVNTIDGESHLVLTEKMENEILDALAGYLRDKTENNLKLLRSVGNGAML